MKIYYIAIILILVVHSGALGKIRFPPKPWLPPENKCSRLAVIKHFSPTEMVCGSNGRTYLSERKLKLDNCIFNKNVTVERKGACSGFIQAFFGGT